MGGFLKLINNHEDAVVRAGRTLAAERNRQGKVIDKISKATGLSHQVISNTDNGVVKKPRLEIVRYGWELGYTPDQVAMLFGYWEPSHVVRDVRLSRLEALINQLPEQEREDTLTFLDNYVATVQRNINEKGA